MPGVSNADIMGAISQLTTEVAVVRTIAEATKAQAEKTNGRVTKVEEWKNALQAIEVYKKEHPSQVINAPNATTVAVAPEKWFQNETLVKSVAVISTTVAAALAVMLGLPR